MNRLLALLLAVLVVGSAVPVEARPSASDLRRDIRNNRKHIKKVKKLLDEANRREKELAIKLADTRTRKAKAEKDLAGTQTSLSAAEEKLRQLKMRMRTTSLRLLRAQTALEKRLRAIYMQGEVSYMAVLLQSDDFTDFLNHADYLQRIVSTDAQLINAVKKHRKDVAIQKAAARETVVQLAQLKAQKKGRLDAIMRLKHAQYDLYKRLKAHQKKLSGRVKEIEHISSKKEAKLRYLIRSRYSPSRPIPASAGAYIYPVNGPITSGFGYRVHPIRGTTRFHSGLDFGVGYGVPILSADNGVVIHSGWYGGYGNTVIVDHGGGYSTLYAHASSLHVRRGDTVLQGQMVSKVGSTGMSTGPHLHFEVRYHGSPVNPFSRL